MENVIIPEFVGFPKIPRLSRSCLVTEKIDGANGQIFITEDEQVFVGSRNRWITPENDNHGFARWAYEHEEELRKLGPGRHFGEFWGHGIPRGYGLKEKRFSLFNVSRWGDDAVRPACCHVVPVICDGIFGEIDIPAILRDLEIHGSYAAPGFMDPEGIVIYHVQGNLSFKKTLLNDAVPKGGSGG